MAKIEMNELLQKTIKNLVKLRGDEKKSLFNLRLKNSMRGLKETHKIRVTRKNVARINTALHIKLNENGSNMK